MMKIVLCQQLNLFLLSCADLLLTVCGVRHCHNTSKTRHTHALLAYHFYFNSISSRRRRCGEVAGGTIVVKPFEIRYTNPTFNSAVFNGYVYVSNLLAPVAATVHHGVIFIFLPLSSSFFGQQHIFKTTVNAIKMN